MRSSNMVGLLGVVVALLLGLQVLSVAAQVTGTKPTCNAGCAGCTVQTVAAQSSVTIESLSCSTGQTVMVRSLSFTPVCTSATQCSNVAVALYLPGNVFGSDNNGCFNQPSPLVLQDQNGNSILTATITVTCSDSTTCSYAALIDVFCQDFIVGHTSSGQFAQHVRLEMAIADNIHHYSRGCLFV